MTLTIDTNGSRRKESEALIVKKTRQRTMSNTGRTQQQ